MPDFIAQARWRPGRSHPKAGTRRLPCEVVRTSKFPPLYLGVDDRVPDSVFVAGVPLRQRVFPSARAVVGGPLERHRDFWGLWIAVGCDLKTASCRQSHLYEATQMREQTAIITTSRLDFLRLVGADFGPDVPRHRLSAGGNVRARLDEWNRGPEFHPSRPLDSATSVRAAMGASGFALAPFRDIIASTAFERREEMSQIAKAEFWGRFDGYLLAPTVLDLLAWAEASAGRWIVDEAQRIQQSLSRPFTWSDLLREHAKVRLQWLEAGADGLGDPTVAVCEFLADYFFVQRAFADDVRWASRYRASGEPAAAVLARAHQAGKLRLRGALSHICVPEGIERVLEAEAWGRVQGFASARTGAPVEGVLSLPMT